MNGLSCTRGLLRGLWVCVAVVGWSAVANATEPAAKTPRKPFNVLFIAVDDLRPALGCYGDSVAITPNIDRLAGRGTLFARAYVQQAVCCPSRLSMLTGLRPDTIQVWDLSTHFRAARPDTVTLPQYFKQHGYHAQSIGKILHGSGKPAQDPPSWSVEPQFDVNREPRLRYALAENLRGSGLKRASSESAPVADDHYVDGQVCRAAITALTQLRQQQRPFFLAVGFRKPHLPFCAPQKYWDLYERNEIPPPATDQSPQGAPELAVRSWKELEGYTDIPNDGAISREQTQRLRHGYYACVSYIDALIGKLLDELEQLDLTDSTVIVLWGDHGFHLGEQGLWAKANNYEWSTRVPLMIAIPGQSTAGSVAQGFVESVDLYPTLVNVCGLPMPDNLEGISFLPLIQKPDRAWKIAVFSQYPRAFEGHRHRRHGDIMGYAIRTTRYRYVQWQNWRTKRVVASELYDLDKDPLESINLADQPGHEATIKRLSLRLEQGWESALPVQKETSQ